MHDNSNKYLPLIIGLAILVIAVAGCYPFCRYYIDPDAVSYLTISERYARGDWQKAINGYWSPWSCWLTAMMIKAGLPAFLSAIVVNTTGAAGLLYVSNSFFRFFHVRHALQWLLTAALSVFLGYAVYKQSFADIWGCFFLLSTLRIILAKQYPSRPALWVWVGILGGCAYFAKAYSFPFFILNTAVCTCLAFKTVGVMHKNSWLKAGITSIAVMVVVSSPWIYLLSQKYGFFTTGTAGSLNMSWFLVGHPYFSESIHALLPPVYTDSPFYWEDPYMVNGSMPQFWHSVRLFGLQMVKLGYNLLKFVRSMNELSAFMLTVWMVTVAIFFSGKVRSYFRADISIVSASLLLFPIGFLPINYEARYIWYLIPLAMLVGALALQQVLVMIKSSRVSGYILMIVFAGSFVVWPMLDMRSMIHTGKEEYRVATKLKELGMSGSFTARATFQDGTMPALSRIAYFAGLGYYQVPYHVPDADILAEIRRYHISYYFHYSENGKIVFKDEHGVPFPEITGIKTDGLQVFYIDRQ